MNRDAKADILTEIKFVTLTENVGANSAMREVLEIFPGAQRALFRRYHIGGCSSCGFSPDETLAQLCASKEFHG